MNPDLFDVTETQARVLRAIAYYEHKTKERGEKESDPFSLYSCNSKLIPKSIWIARSTFGDKNAEKLVQNLMLTQLKKIKHGDRPAKKPYAITPLGQIAWLRHFDPTTKSEHDIPIDKTKALEMKLVTEEHYDIVREIFPDILLSKVDLIINDIDHIGIKHIKDRFAVGILRIALDSIHLEDSSLLSLNAEERIELSESFGLMKTSYIRTYPVINTSMSEQFKKVDKQFRNFDQLNISMVDRVTFLFYYNLIQSVKDTFYLVNLRKGFSVKHNLYTMMKDNKFGSVREVSGLPTAIMRKKKDILELITSNDRVTKIMRDNLEQLKTYKSGDFQTIYDMFLK
jgi:hypothetical protein